MKPAWLLLAVVLTGGSCASEPSGKAGPAVDAGVDTDQPSDMRDVTVVEDAEPDEPDAVPDTAPTGVLSGSLLAGEMRATLPLNCAIRLHAAGTIDLEAPDLFAEPVEQRLLTLAGYPTPWAHDGLEPGVVFHIGVLCDHDDDGIFDNVGGWYLDETGTVATVEVPRRELQIAVGLFRL